MNFKSTLSSLLALLAALLLAACGTPASRPTAASMSAPTATAGSAAGNEIVLYALSLLDTGYRFGGKNPEAGLDCSGMVSYIYARAAGLKISGSAADIARGGRPVERAALRPGDLVFFNTSHRSFSHVGIYLGDARFIHAPSSNGRVRIDALGDPYYAQRFEAARSYFD
ncbi:MAG: C40 family peptidase [Desulfobulbus sp.]|nr:C40 family peptidase [Desulfobulbus sp.]